MRSTASRRSAQGRRRDGGAWPEHHLLPATIRAGSGLVHAAAAAGWRGPDPYDGLLHPWPRPLRGGPRRRQAIVQLHARAPIDIRRLYGRREHPRIPKALALFGQAALRLDAVAPDARLRAQGEQALRQLLADGGAAWGYPFDVQTRWSFYPAGAPNVVVTSFAGDALAEAAERLGEPAFAARADRAARWTLEHAFDARTGAFSYHEHSDAVIHNANLLAARLVWSRLRHDAAARDAVRSAVERSLAAQASDGSWEYGVGGGLAWRDSFHTGFVLLALAELREVDVAVDAALARGARSYEGFFGPAGQARLWLDQPYPEDAHAAGTGLSALVALRELELVDPLLPRRVTGPHARRDAAGRPCGVAALGARQRTHVTYMRWCDAHVARGLADVALANGEDDSVVRETLASMMARMSGARTIVSVVGTRPNFMKIAPICAAIARRDGALRHVLVHTGQHYDAGMSDVFFAELGVGEPDHRLEVGAGSHAQTTARVMERLEPLLAELRPDVVLVPGDVNSALAAALVATKLGLTVGHVEAGLRSFDRTMPEEVNRVVVDAVSDLLFTHSPEAQEHLRTEGRPAEQVHYVGNTMIDTLAAMRERIAANPIVGELGLSPDGVPRRHAPPAGARRRAAAARGARGAAGRRRRAAGRLPGPPAHAGAHRRRGDRARRRRSAAAARAARLPRLPGARRERARGADRLRRHPGGDDVPRRAVPDAARQHRAPGDGGARHERPARPRPRAHPRGAGVDRAGARASRAGAAAVGRTRLGADRRRARRAVSGPGGRRRAQPCAA